MTIRSMEQKLLDLFAEGKLVGTVHTCIGQEFTGIAVCGGYQAHERDLSLSG